MRYKFFILFLFMLLYPLNSVYAWSDLSGGDHEGASWTPADNLIISGVHYNINYFTVTQGYTVYVNTGSELEVHADTVYINGTINGNAKGNVTGVGIGGNGAWQTGVSQNAGGGGGGGYGGIGGTGGNGYYGSAGGTGGVIYGTNNTTVISMGSGGGLGGEGYGVKADGGVGGGSILLSGNSTVLISGIINCNGSNGENSVYSNGGGGGGSGGGVLIVGDIVVVNGIITSVGGNGGTGHDRGGTGGGGAGGRIKIFNVTSINTTGITIDVLGGIAGTGGYSSSGVNGNVGEYNISSVSRPITTNLYTESQINPTHLINFTPVMNWTYSDADSDTQYSWEIQVGNTLGASDMWNTGQLVGTDLNDVYSGSALSRNNTYYVQVRTSDGCLNSDWVTGTFKINSLPILPNVSIHPLAPVLISNLTSNNGTATDSDVDPVTLAYHWYKNNTRVSALTNKTWIYYDNTTDDEVWKVGMVPNDGYENGTEVQSATVTIGSGNTAPTLTSLTSNQSSKKYGYDIKFMTSGAIDADGDHYILSVGSASGLDDICNSTNVSSPAVANCTITINWTSGSRSFYGRLYDGIDTSIEYTTVITVDTTPPIVNSSSVNVSSFQQGGSVLISADIGLANGTISSIVKIRNPSGVSSNYSLAGTGANGTYTYTFTPPSAGNWVVTNIYASDDSGNTLDEIVSYGITVGTTGGGGGGGGGGAITIIELGNLSLSPDVRHTYFWYTAISGEQSARYKYVANRNITSCEVAPNHNAQCEIVDGYVIYVTLIVNETVESYDGVLTVTDEWNYKADARLIVGVIKLTGALPFFNIDVSLLPDGLIQLLETFFEIQDKVIVGIRTFLVGGIGLAFFGALFLAYRS